MKYQVALSFAGENRDYVEKVARILRDAGVTVFYDKYEKETLWGKDLYVHLRRVYQDEAEYTVMFISREYAEKAWTSHERESAQARAFEESREYILPARFDDTEVPGLPRTIGFIDLREVSESEFADLIQRKLALSRAHGGTALSRLPNHELVLKAFDLIARMRELVHAFELDEQSRRTRTMYKSSNDPNWREMWEQESQQDELAALTLKQQYESMFKVDAMLIQGELLKRFPQSPQIPRDEYATHYYDSVRSQYDLRRVIEDLEKLAKSLPVTA